MKAYIIESGHFSAAGNFMGLSTLGEKIHIYKKHIMNEFPMVEHLYDRTGFYDKSLIPFPFYCIAQDKTFPEMNYNGKKTGNTFTRLTSEFVSSSKFRLKATLAGWDDWMFEIVDNPNKHTDRCAQEYKRLLGEHDKLKKDYNDLKQTIKCKSLDLEYAQSERERLEKLCKKYENTIEYQQKELMNIVDTNNRMKSTLTNVLLDVNNIITDIIL